MILNCLLFSTLQKCRSKLASLSFLMVFKKAQRIRLILCMTKLSKRLQPALAHFLFSTLWLVHFHFPLPNTGHFKNFQHIYNLQSTLMFCSTRVAFADCKIPTNSNSVMRVYFSCMSWHDPESTALLIKRDIGWTIQKLLFFFFFFWGWGVCVLGLIYKCRVIPGIII